MDARGPKAATVRSYSTRFLLDEDPISDGGIWVNGGRDGIDWANVITKNGLAHGTAGRRFEQGNLASPTPGVAVPEGDYDDPTALLAGAWGRNQHAKARVFSRNQTEEYFQEVELRLRSTITPHSCTGYEVFWRCLKTEKAYALIVRWNGPLGAWTVLTRKQGPQCGVQDGDLVEATIVGNAIKGYINGVEVTSATDDTYKAGNPGIGFNYGCGDTYVDHGFTYYEVDSHNG